MTRRRIGFLGTGWIGRHRLSAIAQNGSVDIAAIVDPCVDHAHEAQALAPRAAVLASFADLLASDIDGVVIATPSALHAQQAIAALERGMAVFCQKPLGRSEEEVRRVLAAAQAADRLLMVDMSYRQTAAAAKLADLVRSGALGEIFAADLVFHNAYGPDKSWYYDRVKSGGGCMTDLGVHLADLVLWLTGFPEVGKVTTRMFAGGRPIGGGAPEVEDYAVARFDLETGATVQLACSWRLHAGQDAVIEASLYGTQAAACLRNVGGSFFDFELLQYRGTSSERLIAPPDDWGGRTAVAWARQLASDRSFDRKALRYRDVARLIDRINLAAGAE